MRYKALLLLIGSIALGCLLFVKANIAAVVGKAEALMIKAERHSGIVRQVVGKAEETRQLFEEKSAPVNIILDASRDGPIYGDADGLERVKILETKIHEMKIREDHPRIFINKDNIPYIRDKTKLYNQHWQNVLKNAEAGSAIHAAFYYAVMSDAGKHGAQLALNIAKKKLFEMSPQVEKDWVQQKDAAVMALVFDWIYNGLTEDERSTLIAKIERLTRIRERADSIRKGHKEIFETFHREEWVFHSWKAWPEIALAHHVADAEYCYKSRWKYDWFYGDAARMYAYAADGTPFEGYYYGADGADWFVALNSATGINLVDEPSMGWCKNAAYYMLYRLDLGLGREIFHKGVALGNGGILSYSKGVSSWKFKEFLGRTMALASDDPYCKWIIERVSGISPWIITTTGYAGLGEFGDIAYMIFDSPSVAPRAPQYALYSELPYARLFTGGKEAYMRTSWGPESTCVGFTSRPAYTMTSHSDFDVNTFMIYKMGNLAPDSGVYDAYYGQGSYFNYQKNTVSHNDILVVDPSHPDEPRKLGRTADPGGTELVSTRTFGAVTKFGVTDAFIHNPNTDWTKILDFKTTPAYDYIICDAQKAYRTRLDEYIRSLVFIRKGDNAYIIVFDRVDSKNGNFIKKWLLHLVGEPVIKGKKVSSRVPGHYEIFKGDFLVSNNIFNTSRLFLKSLLPKDATISKIGGENFEFYVDGSKPQNFAISDKAKKTVEENLGSTWQEVGTWRIELIPTKKTKRDYFLNTMYVTDMSDELDPNNITLTEEANHFIVNIKDDKLSDVKVSFAKTGKPEVLVDMKQ